MNGNAGSSNSHYIESMSVAYRYVVTGLAPGAHTLAIEYDIKKGYSHAIDYLTHYDRQEPHSQFSHTSEIIDPLIGITGVDTIPITYPIPTPVSNKVVTCTGLLQPATSFNALPASERVFTMFNGTAITDIQYLKIPDLNKSDESQQLQVSFTTTNSTVVFAWGGHIASATDWCPEFSAAGISGSPYHMSLTALDGSGGNSDLSLSAAAVIPVPPCGIIGNQNACPSQAITYSVDPYTGYTYTWSVTNNGTGAFIVGSNTGTSVVINSGTGTGNYTVSVIMSITGYSGTCTKVVSVGIPSLSESHIDYSCSANMGSIDLTASGGFPPYAFQWSNGQTTEDLSGLNAGTYSVTITDQAGCTATIEVPIGATPNLAASVNTTPVTCFGETSGAASSIVSGGTLPYAFSWSTGATTQNIANLTSGTYTVTITDANGCSRTISSAISQPGAALSANTTASPNVSCFGGSNGSVTLFISGGTSPYSFLWSKGSTTQNIDNLIAGTYTVTVTDANGCTLVKSQEITQPAAPLSAPVAASQNVLCHDGTDGFITLMVSGGTPAYSYQWSNGSQTQNLANIPVGAYTVTVTDNNGCTATSAISITQPAASISAASNTTQAVSCFGGNNGAIDLTVAGGTPSYSYIWNNGNTIQDPSGLAAGTYSVTITDANGCTLTHTASVSQPSAALSLNLVTPQQVSCFGGNNGAIDLTVNGGTPGYTYTWSNSSIIEDISGLSAGTYTVSVTDANGCTNSASATITQPSAALTGSTVVTSNISCFSGNNGSVGLTATGGTTPYTYAWNTGAITEDISNLSAGVYIVTVTDANGCTVTITDTITQPAGALSTSIQVAQGVQCFGGNDGNINLTVSGGTPAYTYTWSNGATTEDLQNLSAGVYTATITDVNGCSASVTGTITEPSQAVSASTSVSQQVSCFGGNNGSSSTSVTGGTPPYSFQWSNGATTQSLFNLAAGTYTVTVTDANGCIDTKTAAITQPAASLTSSVSAAQQVNCYGGTNGSINLITSGGTPPFGYNWSNGATTEDISNLNAGTYTVMITDANGCVTSQSVTIGQPAGALSATVSGSQNVNCFGGANGFIDLTIQLGTPPYSIAWSNGATTEDIGNLQAGTYTATITDANGCTTALTTSILQPAGPLNATVSSSSPVNCFAGSDGTIDITVTQGTPPYTFAWSNGAFTEDLTGLPSATYTVTITDAKGCTTIQSATITQPAAAVSASVSSFQNVNCFGGSDGSLALAVAGGTAPYSFLWSNGIATQNLNNLQAGNYSVIITDANGCTSSQSATISEPPATLSSSISSSQNVNCHAGSDGTINLSVSGGTSPYTYTWSNGATTKDLAGLPQGTYTVTVTDANGCTNLQSVVITQPSASLSGTLNVISNVSCFGGSNGHINLTVNGGTTPYSFQWNTGSASEDLSGLASGTYTVTVTDANGCSQSLATTITQPAGALTTSITPSQNVSCFGGTNGTLNLTVSQGTPPYTFGWSNGATTKDIDSLNAGTYTVSVTDANGCTAVLSGTINQPTGALSAAASVTQQVSCFGGNNGQINLSVTAGTPPYIYNWSTGATTEDLNGLLAGTYTVTITDSNGCYESITVPVNQPQGALSTSLTASQNVGCFAGSNGSIDLTIVQGTPPYTFSWSNGATTEDIGNLAAGTYTVMVTDANGCTDSLTAVISQPQGALSLSAATVVNVACHGASTGLIDLTATLGTPPYAFTWNNGSTTEDITGLAAGTYTVVVTDSNGCSDSLAIQVIQPQGALTVSSNVTQQVSCYSGSNGAINLTVQFGTPPYTYSWTNGSTTEDLTGLPAGMYTVVVTDANGCTQNHDVTVTQPSGSLNAVLNVPQNVSCHGGANGTINLTALQGTPPYSFQWSNSSTTKDLTNLSSGTYTVLVTDANGCTYTDSATVTQPAGALNAMASVSQQVSCHGGSNGSINLTVTMGTPPYLFTWSNGATTEDLTGVSTGAYSVTVTDANGCTTATTALVTQPTASLNVTGSSTTSNCLNGSGGAVSINPSGGTAPYTYIWNNGSISQNLSNVPQGSYSVTVTDINGCTSFTQYTVTDVSAFNANATGPTDICVGEIVMLVADSIPGASYQWYLNGQTLGGATYNTFVTPAAGSYSVTINHSCGIYHSDTIDVNLFTVSNVSLSPNVILCPGESTQLNATGGVSYSWTPATGLDFTSVPNPIATPQQTTTYFVEITNEHNCKASGQILVTVMCDTLIIPSGYSPNDDGINDSFVIKGIENYPKNRIWIYNRWGNLIFKARGYENNWNGVSNVGGIYIGKHVPNGTYYYILDLGNGAPPRTGYIVKRQ